MTAMTAMTRDDGDLTVHSIFLAVTSTCMR